MSTETALSKSICKVMDSLKKVGIRTANSEQGGNSSTTVFLTLNQERDVLEFILETGGVNTPEPQLKLLSVSKKYRQALINLREDARVIERKVEK